MTSPIVKSRTQELLRRITQFASPAFKKQQTERLGIPAGQTVGTPVTMLRQLVKGLPRPDQELADSLWQTGVHEARLMAALLADPEHMTRTQLDMWAKEITSWNLCDVCATNVFARVKNPFAFAERCIKKEKELVRRAGFVTLAALAMPRAKTADKDLLKMLPLIKIHAADPRPLVHKAVNGALRNIGKRNPRLTPHALRCAQEILELYEGNRTAVWVSKNALWELNSHTVKKRIAGRN